MWGYSCCTVGVRFWHPSSWALPNECLTSYFPRAQDIIDDQRGQTDTFQPHKGLSPENNFSRTLSHTNSEQSKCSKSRTSLRIVSHLYVFFYIGEWAHVLITSNLYLSRGLFRQEWAVLNTYCAQGRRHTTHWVMDTWRFEPLSLCSAFTWCCGVVSNWHCLCHELFLSVSGTHFKRARCIYEKSHLYRYIYIYIHIYIYLYIYIYHR